MAFVAERRSHGSGWRVPPAASLFWPFTFFAWISFVGLNTLMRGPIVGAFLPTLVGNLMIAVLGIGISIFLDSVISSEAPKAQRLATAVGTVLIASALFAVMDVQIFFSLSGLTLMTVDPANYYSAAGLYGFVLSALGLFYFGLSVQVRRTQSRLREHRDVARATELKALRYQLNPHFLYNTLNATSALILDDQNEEADRTVEHLSRFLRYSLDEGLDDMVTLAKEVEMLKLYLAIEQVRFGSRLNVVFDIDVQAFDCLVPSLLLQPLVENAIKHAIVPYEMGGTIRIGGIVTDQGVDIVISDSGPLQGLDQDTLHSLVHSPGGVGLRNTRQRLLHTYGHAASMDFALSDPHGLRVIVHLPNASSPSGDSFSSRGKSSLPPSLTAQV